MLIFKLQTCHICSNSISAHCIFVKQIYNKIVPSKLGNFCLSGNLSCETIVFSNRRLKSQPHVCSYLTHNINSQSGASKVMTSMSRHSELAINVWITRVCAAFEVSHLYREEVLLLQCRAEWPSTPGEENTYAGRDHCQQKAGDRHRQVSTYCADSAEV